VAEDSADVWARGELFLLDERRRPRAIAGVPPDYFSATGQRWGNPLYDWSAHRATNYAWWIKRMRTALRQVDCLRLDHFRGFEAYWEIPADAPTAQTGRWVPGPGGELFDVLKRDLGDLPLVAEDLGVITPEVDALRERFELPGMCILQFAFGGATEARFLPHHHRRDMVVYTGTHDNDTTLGWYSTLTPAEHDFFHRYVPSAAANPAAALLRLAWQSVGYLAIAPLQDVLGLGTDARMNSPGTLAGNWNWRFARGAVTPALLNNLAELTTTYERGPVN
jgi:4-alpha-glucanotransferase